MLNRALDKESMATEGTSGQNQASEHRSQALGESNVWSEWRFAPEGTGSGHMRVDKDPRYAPLR